MSRVRLTSLMGHMLSVSKKYCVELDPSFVSVSYSSFFVMNVAKLDQRSKMRGVVSRQCFSTSS